MLLLKLKNRLVIWLLTVHLLIAAGYAQGHISVSGVVVDDRNNPVKHAVIGFEFPPPRAALDFGYDVTTPGTFSYPDGGFFLDLDAKSDYVWLVIETPIPEDLVRAVSPARLKQFSEFRGLKLKVPKDKKIVYQLDYIKPHISYRKVELGLKMLFAKDIVGEAYSLNYTVRHKGKLVLNNVQLDKRSFDYATKTLKIAFPTGNWELTMKLKVGKKVRVKHFALSLR